jgi:hypothetical protein
MGDAAIAVTVGFVLAVLVAFRRVRGVLTPEARREVSRKGNGAMAARVAVGAAALVAIVWVTRQLFT